MRYKAEITNINDDYWLPNKKYVDNEIDKVNKRIDNLPAGKDPRVDELFKYIEIDTSNPNNPIRYKKRS